MHLCHTHLDCCSDVCIRIHCCDILILFAFINYPLMCALGFVVVLYTHLELIASINYLDHAFVSHYNNLILDHCSV